ncbi:hypothetical protein [Spiroplasma taiwanense]|uniref:Uncharacterized protein n=1 Tax=Spiroplasma taiwanense CT-1 TaxID=1276220 RepID=S5MBX3_9MOLU|nr:hypothetical protein [Spiroplasma taiwanense]AGR41238.1 hypothetical protein STAIW_v1c06160 [Spiroplasma taiwanense CT-1]
MAKVIAKYFQDVTLSLINFDLRKRVTKQFINLDYTQTIKKKLVKLLITIVSMFQQFQDKFI